MSARILKNYLTIFVTLVISALFIGCADKVYVDRPYEVKVPVRVEMPTVKCYPKQSTYTEEIKELRLCIERYKEVINTYSEEAK